MSLAADGSNWPIGSRVPEVMLPEEPSWTRPAGIVSTSHYEKAARARNFLQLASIRREPRVGGHRVTTGASS
jgi:hypothetical protein